MTVFVVHLGQARRRFWNKTAFDSFVDFLRDLGWVWVEALET